MVVLISFIFWAVFWSFISVLIHRLRTNEKWILFWRSKCPSCQTKLSSKDLIPIFSYIFLKWKCQYCKKNIWIIYPLLEIITWLVFVLITYVILWNFQLESFINNLTYVIYGWIVGVLFIALAFYDILYYEIEFKLVWILALLLLFPQFIGIIWNWKLALLLWIVGFIIFIWISFFRLKVKKVEGMWWWDAIGAWIIGFLLPILIDLLNLDYPIWASFYIILMMWFFLWAIAWIIWISFKKLNLLAKLPFLPFLFGWIIFFIFCGNRILSWLFM